MSGPLFDMRLRAIRRDRAFRQGPALFLHERAFAEILERLSIVNRRFDSALLLGCPDPSWPGRLCEIAGAVTTADPGRLFAQAAQASLLIEDEERPGSGPYDLCVAVGTLDTVNNLPGALRNIRSAMEPDSLLIGVVAGGDSLPALRAAMRAADEAMGAASPHVHPRIQAAALGALLAAAGFTQPVVDVDRVAIAYSSIARLVADLRAMGATNILTQRSQRPLGKKAMAAAALYFESAAVDGRTTETIELLHFAAWTPPSFQG